MRKLSIAIVLALVLAAPQLGAQGKFGATPEDSIECVKYLTFYKDYFKSGKIKEALPSWHGAINICPPMASQNLFIDGQKIMQYLIARAQTPAQKKSYIDSLIMMYDIRLQNFKEPKYQKSASTYKVRDMVKYCSDDAERIHTAAKEAIEIADGVVDADILVYTLNSGVQMFQNQTLDADVLMAEYEQLCSLFDNILAKASPENKEALEKAHGDFETLFAHSGLADADNLIALYEPKFDENAENVAWLKKTSDLLSRAGAESSDLFLKSVEALNKLEPSSKSAYYLYKLYASREDFQSAANYLQMAIDAEDSDNATDAEYLMQLGAFYVSKMRNSAKGAECAKMAIQKDEAVAGKAYLLLGQIWSGAKIEGSEIEANSNFWVAVDYLNKAKAADESLASECNKLIAQYVVYFPTKADVFMHDLNEGSSFTVRWNGMSATTTVRCRKED